MESVIDAQVPVSVPALRVIPEQTRLGATAWMDCCPPLSATLVLAQSWCDYTSHVLYLDMEERTGGTCPSYL